MLYDAAGERLIRRDPDGSSTLYLAGAELKLTGGAVVGKRYYSAADGSTVALRTSAGVTWILSGLHGSNQIAINDTTGQVSRERYTPFGKRRGADDLPFTDRGFLGKVEDGSTGLIYLSVRYYDPAIAKFISTDPLLDLRNPQFANPYSYAGNNPIGLSDPNGQAACRPDDCPTKSAMKWTMAHAEKDKKKKAKALKAAHRNDKTDADRYKKKYQKRDKRLTDLYKDPKYKAAAKKLADEGKKASPKKTKAPRPQLACIPVCALPVAPEVGAALGVLGTSVGLAASGVGNWVKNQVRKTMTTLAMMGAVVSAVAGDDDGEDEKGTSEDRRQELLDRPSQIADRLGVSLKEVKDAIHGVKRKMPRSGARKNPDVLVDPKTGEVYPKLPDGSPGEDSIGNLWDFLPE